MFIFYRIILSELDWHIERGDIANDDDCAEFRKCCKFFLQFSENNFYKWSDMYGFSMSYKVGISGSPSLLLLCRRYSTVIFSMHIYMYIIYSIYRIIRLDAYRYCLAFTSMCSSVRRLDVKSNMTEP